MTISSHYYLINFNVTKFSYIILCFTHKVIIEKEFREKVGNLFGHLLSTSKQLNDDHLRNLYFGDFMKGKDENRFYDEISDFELLKQVIENYLNDYNLSSKTQMDLVIFGFVIEHISRISRILKQPNGHALLIGIGGTGRTSATKLATFIADYEYFQIEMSKNYSMNDWRGDIKNLLKKAGFMGKNTVFFLADHQVKEELFLEDVNMLLNTADIPALYENDEKLEIIERMQQIHQKEQPQAELSALGAYNKFIERIRLHLHIVLAFSPLGESFRNRLRMYPALINCCTIDWFKSWPDDALELVANKFLDDVEIADDIRKQTVVMCKHFHQSIVSLSEKYYEALRRRNYVTPTSYLELIKTFKVLLDRKRLQILTMKDRYVIGIEKLELSESQVALMQTELTELQPQLIKTSEETEELIKIIEKDASEVDVVKQNVEAEKEIANRAANEAQAIKEYIFFNNQVKSYN